MVTSLNAQTLSSKMKAPNSWMLRLFSLPYSKSIYLMDEKNIPTSDNIMFILEQPSLELWPKAFTEWRLGRTVIDTDEKTPITGASHEPIKSRSHRSEAQRRKTRHNIMLTTWRLYSCLACRARWHRDGCQVWTRTPLCRSTHTANTRFPQGPVQHQYSV